MCSAFVLPCSALFGPVLPVAPYCALVWPVLPVPPGPYPPAIVRAAVIAFSTSAAPPSAIAAAPVYLPSIVTASAAVSAHLLRCCRCLGSFIYAVTIASLTSSLVVVFRDHSVGHLGL
eukprot:scaffold7954_cov70-Cyclotella_meneghiniana.AAC.1